MKRPIKSHRTELRKLKTWFLGQNSFELLMFIGRRLRPIHWGNKRPIDCVLTLQRSSLALSPPSHAGFLFFFVSFILVRCFCFVLFFSTRVITVDGLIQIWAEALWRKHNADSVYAHSLFVAVTPRSVAPAGSRSVASIMEVQWTRAWNILVFTAGNVWIVTVVR